MKEIDELKELANEFFTKAEEFVEKMKTAKNDVLENIEDHEALTVLNIWEKMEQATKSQYWAVYRQGQYLHFEHQWVGDDIFEDTDEDVIYVVDRFMSLPEKMELTKELLRNAVKENI